MNTPELKVATTSQLSNSGSSTSLENCDILMISRSQKRTRDFDGCRNFQVWNTIFHAFSMTYQDIAKVAPRLSEMGFTHVQFSPIQTTRTLTVSDVDLLQAQLRSRDSHLLEFDQLCRQANEKTKLYAPHNFNYLLYEHAFYIRQPTFQQAHMLLLKGIPYSELLDILYSNPLAVGKAIQANPMHAFVKSLELVLTCPEEPTGSEEDLRRRILDNDTQYKKIQAQLKKERTPHLIQLHSQFKKEYSRLSVKLKTFEKYNNHKKLLKELESELISFREYIESSPISPPPASKPQKEHWLNLVFLAELLLYPPWWLIYQPIQMAIGDTFLGSKEDILAAIRICKQNKLEVIADIVINNLAATVGERGVWKKASIATDFVAATTLQDVADHCSTTTLQKVQHLLQHALNSSDLTLLTAPKDCVRGQEPTQCWMSLALPQLNQNHSLVQKTRNKFLSSLVDVGISGIRIDAAAHLTPDVCFESVSHFKGLSYIEYVGGSESWRKYPENAYSHIRMEDFSIGEDVYTRIFSEQADYNRIKNWGSSKLHRHPNLDSVTMIVNHDHIMKSIPSAVFANLPSEITYELSVVYLIQRIYGNVLLLPHDMDFLQVQRAIQLRKKMKDAGIVREYVHVDSNTIVVEKYNSDNELRFIVVINISDSLLYTRIGSINPYSFEWVEMGSIQGLLPMFTSIKNTWKQLKGKTRTRKLKKITKQKA